VHGPYSASKTNLAEIRIEKGFTIWNFVEWGFKMEFLTISISFSGINLIGWKGLSNTSIRTYIAYAVPFMV